MESVEWTGPGAALGECGSRRRQCEASPVSTQVYEWKPVRSWTAQVT